VFGAQSIAVTLDDGRSAPARIVGIDPIFDLALLRIPVAPETNLPTLELEDDALVRVGDEVVAIGNPLGLDQTLTRGVVSALNRELAGTPLSFSRPMIQTDTPINPGNSGGPLLDRCGRVVGINTSIIADAQGIGFAIPATLVASVVPVLIRDGGIARPWLGFHGQLVTPRLAALLRIPLVLGLLVEVVEPDSPAAKAKIRGGVTDISIAGNEILIGGDIVTEMNGIKLVSDAALARAMQTMAVGKALRLRLYRDGEHFTVSYRTPKRPILPSDVQY
jgi:S1-C subfamily serine protease